MPQSSKPKDAQSKPERHHKPLDEAELEKVAGGKVTTAEIKITKPADKSSP